jgi:hypothetical protein
LESDLSLPQKVQSQIAKARLTSGGQIPFIPRLVTNRRGQQEIEEGAVLLGPKKDKVGYVDSQGRIWIKDRAHADYPDRWDVQENAGATYVKVDFDGNLLV